MNALSTRMRLAIVLLVAGAGALVATADVLTFYPTDDTYIVMRDPDTPHGSSPELIVENRYGSSVHPYYWEMDALLNFDLSSIPPGTDVTSATLNLFYYAYHDSNPAGRVLTCYKLAGPWSEGTATFNDAPGHLFQPTSFSSVPDAPGAWMSWDVTADVQALVNNPGVNFGWGIMDEKAWDNFNIPWTRFRSKEYGSFIPELGVSLVPEPGSLLLLCSGVATLLRRRNG